MAGVDPRAKWDILWKRIKSLFRDEKKRRHASRDCVTNEVAELQRLRERLSIDPDPDLLPELTRLEAAVRKREREDAIAWKRRSRVKWLSVGDAPSHFFFAQLRAKHINETICCIKKEDGSSITDEKEIIRETEQYFRELFTRDEDIQRNDEERQEILQLLPRKLSSVAAADMDRIPDLAEVESVVKGLPSDKAPGLDGLTSEVLKACWSWVSVTCLELVQAFWKDGVLTISAVRGVLCLIPKGGDLDFLRNWRPITMLNLVYKIISKLLANRLKPLMGLLIDSQQSGFIAGRSIVDNLLIFRIAKEHALRKNLQAILLMVDFMKAFDRLDHIFLRDTLRALGFSEFFIMLVMVLVSGGASKIHVNGMFSEEFNLDRGVRQGCPLASLLFALSS